MTAMEFIRWVEGCYGREYTPMMRKEVEEELITWKEESISLLRKDVLHDFDDKYKTLPGTYFICNSSGRVAAKLKEFLDAIQ